jgi:hypothetical protein
LGSRTVNFPVKFPVSREFIWRQVRSALRRQPGSAVLGENAWIFAEKPANGGLLRINYQSPGSDFRHSQSGIADSLQRKFEKLPFLGDCDRRPGSIRTVWPSLRCSSPNSPPGPPTSWECLARTADWRVRYMPLLLLAKLKLLAVGYGPEFPSRSSALL